MSRQDFQNGFAIGLLTQANILNQNNMKTGKITFADGTYHNAVLNEELGFVPSVVVLLPAYEVDYSSAAIHSCIMLQNGGFRKLKTAESGGEYSSSLCQAVFKTDGSSNTGSWSVVSKDYDVLGTSASGGGVINSGEIIFPVADETAEYLADVEYDYIVLE